LGAFLPSRIFAPNLRTAQPFRGIGSVNLVHPKFLHKQTKETKKKSLVGRIARAAFFLSHPSLSSFAYVQAAFGFQMIAPSIEDRWKVYMTPKKRSAGRRLRRPGRSRSPNFY
jgi:hypothetical protein